jgi:hypothetical protein
MPLPYGAHNYLGEFATDALATANAVAKGWDTGGNPRAGMEYYNTTSNTRKYWNGAAWVSAGFGLSMDDAYDAGGAGAGRQITVDSGPVQLNVPAGVLSGDILLIDLNNNVTGTFYGIDIDATGMTMGGKGLAALVNIDYSTLTTGVCYGLFIAPGHPSAGNPVYIDISSMTKDNVILIEGAPSQAGTITGLNMLMSGITDNGFVTLGARMQLPKLAKGIVIDQETVDVSDPTGPGNALYGIEILADVDVVSSAIGTGKYVAFRADIDETGVLDCTIGGYEVNLSVLNTAMPLSRRGYYGNYDGTLANSNLYGVYQRFRSLTVNDGGIGVYGIYIDYNSATITSANNVIGIQIDMPNVPSSLPNPNAININCTPYTRAIMIYDTGSPAFAKNDIRVNANCGAITAAQYFRGMYLDINETVVGNDGSFIVGHQVDLTGFATGRADLFGHRIMFDGTKSGGDATRGILVGGTMTINNAAELFYGAQIDLSSMTFTDLADGYGLLITMPASYTAAKDIVGIVVAGDGRTVQICTNDRAMLITGDVEMNGGDATWFQPPKMTTAQENVMVAAWGAPEAGRMWYNTTTNQWDGWNGAAIIVIG